MTGRYAALILAAGLSSRMGRSKLLLPLSGGNVLETTAAYFRAAGIKDIYVVLGYEAERIRNNCREADTVTFVHNEHYELDMFTSVQAGVRAMGPDIAAFLLTPADCPLVAAATVRELIHRHEATAAPIVLPTYQGKAGHPCLVSMQYRDEILRDVFPAGMRTLLQRHAAEVLRVPVPDEAVLWDMDTPAQYEFIRHKSRERQCPPTHDRDNSQDD